MSEWEPGEYDADPMVNAVMNVARELRALSTATHQLLYGLKYSDERGLSIAEAIEKASETIAAAMPEAWGEVPEEAAHEADEDPRG